VGARLAAQGRRRDRGPAGRGRQALGVDVPPYDGRAGLRHYLDECFAEESRPAVVWFAEPRVDGDLAAVEYWAQIYAGDQPTTISGCTLVRFDESGFVAEARDYSHVREGHPAPCSSTARRPDGPESYWLR
jgi:hypothetical protein